MHWVYAEVVDTEVLVESRCSSLLERVLQLESIEVAQLLTCVERHVGLLDFLLLLLLLLHHLRTLVLKRCVLWPIIDFLPLRFWLGWLPDSFPVVFGHLSLLHRLLCFRDIGLFAVLIIVLDLRLDVLVDHVV